MNSIERNQEILAYIICILLLAICGASCGQRDYAEDKKKETEYIKQNCEFKMIKPAYSYTVSHGKFGFTTIYVPESKCYNCPVEKCVID